MYRNSNNIGFSEEMILSPSLTYSSWFDQGGMSYIMSSYGAVGPKAHRNASHNITAYRH